MLAMRALRIAQTAEDDDESQNDAACLNLIRRLADSRAFALRCGWDVSRPVWQMPPAVPGQPQWCSEEPIAPRCLRSARRSDGTTAGNALHANARSCHPRRRSSSAAAAVRCSTAARRASASTGASTSESAAAESGQLARGRRRSAR
jgi:hypothetical protein